MAPEYWVVVVQEETTAENQGREPSHRFVFDDGAEAVACWASAMANGFSAHTEHVMNGKHRVLEDA